MKKHNKRKKKALGGTGSMISLTEVLKKSALNITEAVEIFEYSEANDGNIELSILQRLLTFILIR